MTEMADVPQPPWVVFPDLPRGMGWRMGGGEEVYNAFYRWFSALTDEQAAQFAENNPAPGDWQHLYATIRKHPWK